jgi:hypothetical protein
MTDTRLWDRAADLPAPLDGRRFPQVAALGPGLPTVPELFDFMRDAETRFGSLRLRILEQTWTARGEQATRIEVMLRHPGAARVTTSDPAIPVGGPYEVWLSDGEIVRTYASAHKLGTQRPIRNRPRGLDDPDFPGTARVYEPITGLPMETLPDTFVHPAGYCQNVLATGDCVIRGEGEVHGRAAVLLDCAHPRAIERVADRPDFAIAIAVDRQLGIILRLVETLGGTVTRHAEATDVDPDAPLPPSAFEFVFPTGTTMLY